MVVPVIIRGVGIELENPASSWLAPVNHLIFNALVARMPHTVCTGKLRFD